MKTRIIALLFIATTLFVGCKNDKSIDDLKVVDNKPKESKVKITMDVIVPEDDVFQIYYTQDGTANVTDDKSVKAVIKGSPTSQKIVFDFPEDIAIAYLRIDVGENKNQGKMTFNNFVYEYYGKKFEAKGNQFFQYFTPTEDFEFNFNESTIIPKKKDNYDPILYGNPDFLSEKLKEVLK